MGVDQGKKVTIFNGLSSQLPGGDLYILFTHGPHHITGRQATGSYSIRIEPRPHGVVPTAEDLRVPDPFDPGQPVTDIQSHIVAQVEGVVFTAGRGQVNDHQKRWRLLLGGDALPTHGFRQSGFRLADAVLHPNGGLLSIGTRAEGDGHLQHTVRARHGLEVHHILNAVDGFFQWRGDRFGDLLRVSAGVDRANDH